MMMDEFSGESGGLAATDRQSLSVVWQWVGRVVVGSIGLNCTDLSNEAA
jgi:hypothetical protein